MTISEIVQRMNEQAEQIARYLLPQGKNSGREWEVGSIDGAPGRSMKVCIAGGKIGIWSDFAAGTSGDLLDLWREVRGLSDNKTALAEVKEYLGISGPHFEHIKKKEYRRPTPPKSAKKAVVGSAVTKYLTEERKLSLEAIEAYKLGQIAEVGPFDGWKSDKPATGPWIVFPYFRSEELLGVKYLHLERKDGKKFTLVEPGCEPTCFGWHVIAPNAREITICEGEIDAVTLWQYGRPALSVPFGGGKGDKQQWVDCDWDYLEAFETIYLCLDNDKEGEAATEELVKRLGIYRCKIVTLPFKDANECLKKAVSLEEINQCFDEAKTIEPEELKAANHFTKEVIGEFYPAGGKLSGFDMPWAKVPFRFLRGEVTVITGVNAHGKSLLWGQVLLSGSVQGECVCIASLEMHPRKTLYRMVRQATGKKFPSPAEIEKSLDWMAERVWLFNLVGTGKIDRMLQVFEYAFRRHGVKQFLIDSMMKCGIAEDDYAGQKAMLEALCDFAARTGAHIHLVTHSRKKDNEMVPLGKMDVKGTGAITDLAFNFFSIWRNKNKEFTIKAFENNEALDLPRGTTIETIKAQPDAVLICDKSRNVDDAEGKYLLWFEKNSMLYCDTADCNPAGFHVNNNPSHWQEEELPYGKGTETFID